MKNRLVKLRSCFSELGVDALFVSDPVNVRYLTGYPAEDAWLLVTGCKAFYITDFRYIEYVKKALKGKGVEPVQFERSVFETALQWAVRARARTLGFEENHLTCHQYGRLKAFAGSRVRLKGLSGAVEALRAVKGPREILAIREAVKMNLKGFEFIKEFICPGVTERDILYKLQDWTREQGVGFSFPPIIASGPNSAYPHARSSERKLRSGEPVLLDFGVEKDGYKSDLTRMFFLGRMPRSFEKNLSLIRDAQEEAFKKIRPGVKVKEVDAAARGFLDKHGIAKHFGHSLGHGVGLNTHEMPRISGKSGEILLKNMVITVEPGVYFRNRYGVRLEEMVLITNNGYEVLSGHRDH